MDDHPMGLAGCGIVSENLANIHTQTSAHFLGQAGNRERSIYLAGRISSMDPFRAAHWKSG
jgi:hypothetical protein